jgi:UDP-N-acetylglucosamine 2-epimerase
MTEFTGQAPLTEETVFIDTARPAPASRLKEDIAHVEAVLRMVDLSFEPERLPAKRISHRSKLHQPCAVLLLRETLAAMEGAII